MCTCVTQVLSYYFRESTVSCSYMMIPSQLADLVVANHHIWMVLVTWWSQYLKKVL